MQSAYVIYVRVTRVQRLKERKQGNGFKVKLFVGIYIKSHLKAAELKKLELWLPLTTYSVISPLNSSTKLSILLGISGRTRKGTHNIQYQ
jgi:hypothetical protein